MLFTGVITEGNVQVCPWQGLARAEIDMKYREWAECGDGQVQGSWVGLAFERKAILFSLFPSAALIAVGFCLL